ncbi:MAG TPA: hypothetical protein VEK11_12970 [Thermoanaerobaculia bacterium]|nr:hypothetical protein [Thermoanaerobaculia bacterium]
MNTTRDLLRSSLVLLFLLVPVSPLRAAAQAARSDVARDCAARLLTPVAIRNGVDLTKDTAQSEWLHVQQTHKELPLELYTAELLTRRPGYVVTFIPDAGCTLIGGDVSELLGIPMTQDEVASFTVVQYNRAVRKESDIRYESPLSIAQALVQLVYRSNSRRILNTVDEISLPQSRRLRRTMRRTLNTLRRQLQPPRIERGAGNVMLVRIYTWDPSAGVVLFNTVILLPDGRVALSASQVR